MLSQEDRSKLTPEETLAAIRDANQASRRLAKSLVTCERNENPHEERNAVSPAHGVVHIRLIRPRPVSITYGDDVAVQNHNLFVASLGKEGTRFGA